MYSADFKINEKETSAEFDPKGNWIQTKTEIQFNEVSEKLLADVKKRYATFTLNEVEPIESDKGTFYEFELSKPNNIVEALYRKNGKFISELSKSYKVNEDD